MSLYEMLPKDLGGKKIKVTLNDGTEYIGRYIGYTRPDENYDDEGNELGIASIDLDEGEEGYSRGLYEDDIKSVELA